MKYKIWLAAIAIAALLPMASLAQAPSGSTGQCKDGTYTTAVNKSGACSGHKGVQTWYAATNPKTTASTPSAALAPRAQSQIPSPPPAAAVTHSNPAPSTTTQHSSPSTMPTAGGGPGVVWVNTSTKVYHCQGTAYYGKTKAGKYMSESDAKAMGAHADHDKACTTQ
jgi:hypothetical protein